MLSSLNQRVTPSPVISATLLGRQITFITMPTLIYEVQKACEQKRKLTIASCNIHSFNLSMQLPWFYEFMQKADIVRCDGMGILKVVKRLGLNLSSEYRASGTRLVPALLEHSSKTKLSFFLLGSKPDSLEKALKRIHTLYPELQVTGHHGYFQKDNVDECNAIVQKINQAKPDILIVGMGMPVQEDWVYRYRDKLDVPVVLPCGAVIDRLAGMVSDCPRWISELGCEWLYRLLKEPKRLASRYFFGNLAFVLHLGLALTYSSPLKIQGKAETVGKEIFTPSLPQSPFLQ